MAVDGARLAIWEFDIAENRLIPTPEIADVFGLSPQQTEDTGYVFSRYHPGDRERVRETAAIALAEGKLHFEAEFRFIDGKDEIRWLMLRARIVWENNQAKRVIGVVFDVSIRKVAEEALRNLTDTLEEQVLARSKELLEAEEALRQSQKMEAVGRLARGVAHDFNNVLAAIMGGADLMVARLHEGDPSRAEAQAIMKAAERGAALTRQLLTFSRRQALEPRVLDLHAVIRGVEDMVLRLTGDVTVRLHTPGASPQVRVEPGQIEQVLLNLVVNARDALAEGGTIDVTADAIDLDERSALDYHGIPPGSYARLSVRDNGTGIAPEAQRHAFEPFFTTKGPSKGTGLGLSIVYGIAKEAGGTVTFSTSPKGTTFEVLLPRVQQGVTG